MGDMADMYDDYPIWSDDENGWVNHDEDIRKDTWVTKDGKSVDIGDMTDKHLLNSYKLSGDERLFAEMVVRLFEVRVARKEETSGFLLR